MKQSFTHATNLTVMLKNKLMVSDSPSNHTTLKQHHTTFTVQLGYCDSDVTVCLLFWNIPIIQDRDVKYPYKQYIYYLQAF